MLFTTRCTGWILKKRTRKLVFLQQCQQKIIGETNSVNIFPLTPDQPPLKGGRYVIFTLAPDQPPFKGGRYV